MGLLHIGPVNSSLKGRSLYNGPVRLAATYTAATWDGLRFQHLLNEGHALASPAPMASCEPWSTSEPDTSWHHRSLPPSRDLNWAMVTSPGFYRTPNANQPASASWPLGFRGSGMPIPVAVSQRTRSTTTCPAMLALGRAASCGFRRAWLHREQQALQSLTAVGSEEPSWTVSTAASRVR